MSSMPAWATQWVQGQWRLPKVDLVTNQETLINEENEHCFENVSSHPSGACAHLNCLSSLKSTSSQLTSHSLLLAHLHLPSQCVLCHAPMSPFRSSRLVFPSGILFRGSMLSDPPHNHAAVLTLPSLPAQPVSGLHHHPGCSAQLCHEPPCLAFPFTHLNDPQWVPLHCCPVIFPRCTPNQAPSWKSPAHEACHTSPVLSTVPSSSALITAFWTHVFCHTS